MVDCSGNTYEEEGVCDLDIYNLKGIYLPPDETVTTNGPPWAHSPNHFFRIILPPSDSAHLGNKPKDIIIEKAWGKDLFI
jgi:hypothetical protein